MNADSEFLKLAREMRYAQRIAYQPYSRPEERMEAAKREALFDAAIARMTRRQEPGL